MPKGKLKFKIQYEKLYERPSTEKYFFKFKCLSYILNTNQKGKIKKKGIGYGNTFYVTTINRESV